MIRRLVGRFLKYAGMALVAIVIVAAATDSDTGPYR